MLSLILFFSVVMMAANNDTAVFKNSVFVHGLLHKLIDIVAIANPKLLPNTSVNMPYFWCRISWSSISITCKYHETIKVSRKKIINKKIIFNYCHSRARRVIENAFGILAQRWRVFRKPVWANIDTIENVIKCCVTFYITQVY